MPDSPTPPASGARWSRLVLALVALALVVTPLRGAWWDPAGKTLLAPDTATVAAPWSVALAESGALAGDDGAPLRRPRNGGLSDQGLVFYPHYRYLSDQLRAGRVPLWNPLNYTGAPLAGNPQAGLFDPQVLLPVALDLAFGRTGFHVGLVLGYSLRLALAFLGAFYLARRLGLGFAGALLAGIGFASSGYLQVWLGAPLSHVTPFLPWVLLGVERCRERGFSGAALAAVSLALAIYGGHPETAFYIGAAAGLWSLSLWRERAGFLWSLGGLAVGTLLSMPVLLPFVEYLGMSAAQLLRARAQAQRGFDVAALGGVAVGALALRSLARGGGSSGAPWVRLVGGALAACGLWIFLHSRGLPPGTLLAAFPEAFGHPGRGGYRGPGLFLEEASAALPAVVLALAALGAFAERSALRGRALIALIGLLAWALALRVPGLLELKQRVPLVGLGATVRLAAVSALMLSLLAGAGLEALREATRSREERARRWAALGVLLGSLLGLWGFGGAASERDLGAVEDDPLYGLLLGPEARESRDGAPLEGWVVGGLPVDSVRLLARGLDDDHVRFALPAELFDAPSERARQRASESLAGVPSDARFFRTEYLQLNRLEVGAWRLSAQFIDAGGQALAERELVRFELVRSRDPRPWTLGAWFVGLVLLGAGAGRRWVVPVSIAAALGQGLLFAEGLHPAIPVAEAFPETRTEAVLAEVLAERPGGGRFLSDPGVMLPSSGLVRGLSAVDGYDGMEPADYAQYRPLALKPGVSPLLGWNARGVDLDAATFELLGVHALVTTSPLEHPDWELVAGPGRERVAECFVYRAIDPLPRVLAPTEVIEPLALLEHLQAGGAWDPQVLAATELAKLPAPKATTYNVRDFDQGPNHVHFTVELDGHALVTLTDLYFPGWVATVDDEPAKLWKTNAMFRGVEVGPGVHRVRMDYRPRSLKLGLAAALAGLGIAIVAGARVALRRRTV
jgi:hypothetical protein